MVACPVRKQWTRDQYFRPVLSFFSQLIKKIKYKGRHKGWTLNIEIVFGDSVVKYLAFAQNIDRGYTLEPSRRGDYIDLLQVFLQA